MTSSAGYGRSSPGRVYENASPKDLEEALGAEAKLLPAGELVVQRFYRSEALPSRFSVT